MAGSVSLGSENLGTNLEDYVEELVRSGRFTSREDVLREGVRLLQVKERRQTELDAALDRGLAQAEAGLGTPADEVLAHYEAKYAAMRKDRKA